MVSSGCLESQAVEASETGLFQLSFLSSFFFLLSGISLTSRVKEITETVNLLTICQV